MEKKMTFNYFYGTEADQFSFYRITSNATYDNNYNSCNKYDNFFMLFKCFLHSF